MDDQPGLPFAPPPVLPHRETRRFHAAVVVLRRLGYGVYRVSSAQHRVCDRQHGDRLLTSREVMRMARAAGQRSAA